MYFNSENSHVNSDNVRELLEKVAFLQSVCNIPDKHFTEAVTAFSEVQIALDFMIDEIEAAEQDDLAADKAYKEMFECANPIF